MNISHRLRAGVVVGALCTIGVSAQSIAAQAAQSPLNGPYCSGGVAVTGPGSTAQNNAMPGFNSTLTAGGETDLLGNVVPGCAGESMSDSLGGSGAGVAAAVNHSAPISFSDDPLNASNHALATAGPAVVPPESSPIHQVPVAILPVSVIYNLSCFSGTLNLSSIDLAKMYDGVITQWGDPTLVLDNPGLSACTGVHINLTARADSSGTTYVFKSYLSHRNPEYVALKQDALNTTWPADTTGLNPIACRGNGTGAEIACVLNTMDSVGYAGSSNVRKNVPPPSEAAVDDPEHTFMKWTPGSCALAALTAPIPPTTLGNWSGVDFTDSPVPGAYAICGYTYDFAFQNYKTAFNGTQSVNTMQTVVDFLTAATSTKGQATLPTDIYDQLPLPTQTVAQEAALDITYK